MCRMFGVSRSGYYDWVQHKLSDRKQSDDRLKQEIKVAHIRTRETYGTCRLQTELADNGIIIGRDRLDDFVRGWNCAVSRNVSTRRPRTQTTVCRSSRIC